MVLLLLFVCFFVVSTLYGQVIFCAPGGKIVTTSTGMVLTVPLPPAPVVGDSYGGGIVAYIYQSGDPGYVVGKTLGLIAATSDQGAGITWWNGSNVKTGATLIALGMGSVNTTAIINKQGDTGIYAAKLCRDYKGGGYNDWYLPSVDELQKLYLNQKKIGGFTTATSLCGACIYWISNELDNMYANYQYFSNGAKYVAEKSIKVSVRAIRCFLNSRPDDNMKN